VVDDGRIGVLEHAVGEDSVQVERGDDGDVFAENLACFLQEITLGVLFLGGGHGTVQGEVGTIDCPDMTQRVEEFASEAFEVGPGDGPPR
jgi:hypothetical protein